LSRPAISMAEFYHDGEDGNIGRGMIFSLRFKRQVLGLSKAENIQKDRPRTVHFLFNKYQPRLLHQKGHVAAH